MIFVLMWLFFSSGGCWDFWDFWEQLLHLDPQLVSDEEHLQPVVGKSISFIFVFKNIFNNNNQLCSLNSNLAKGSYGHKVIWVMIAFLFTLAFIKAFIHFCPQLHTITVHCIQWYGAIRKSLMVGTYTSVGDLHCKNISWNNVWNLTFVCHSLSLYQKKDESLKYALFNSQQVLLNTQLQLY